MAAKHAPPDADLELNQFLPFKEDLRHHSLGNGESVDLMSNGGRGSFHGSYSYAPDGRPASRHAGPRTGFQRWMDSFRRDPKGRMTPKNAFVGGRGRNYYDLRAANYRTAHSLLAKELKGRHLQMIAIGGSIGQWSCRLRMPLFPCFCGLPWPIVCIHGVRCWLVGVHRRCAGAHLWPPQSGQHMCMGDGTLGPTFVRCMDLWFRPAVACPFLFVLLRPVSWLCIPSLVSMAIV